MDYVITPDPDQFISDILFMSTDPVTVNVTLLSDGVGGEGSEEIGITLVQLSPVEEFRVLTRPTVTITVRDNDSMHKININESLSKCVSCIATAKSCSSRTMALCSLLHAI